MAIENSVYKDFYLRSSIVFTFSIAAFPVLYLANVTVLNEILRAMPWESLHLPQVDNIRENQSALVCAYTMSELQLFSMLTIVSITVLHT